MFYLGYDWGWSTPRGVGRATSIGLRMSPVLALVAVACFVAGIVWGRSALRFRSVWRRVEGEPGAVAFGLVLIPVAVSLGFSTEFVRDAHLAEDRASIERRAEEVLTQEELARKRWAARLAPEDL